MARHLSMVASSSLGKLMDIVPRLPPLSGLQKAWNRTVVGVLGETQWCCKRVLGVLKQPLAVGNGFGVLLPEVSRECESTSNDQVRSAGFWFCVVRKRNSGGTTKSLWWGQTGGGHSGTSVWLLGRQVHARVPLSRPPCYCAPAYRRLWDPSIPPARVLPGT